MKKQYRPILDVFFSDYKKNANVTDILIGLKFNDDIDGLAKLKPIFFNVDRECIFELIINYLELNTDYIEGE